MLEARALLDGQLPYIAVFDDKPLGAPVLIAVAMKVVGASLITVRLLGCLAVVATALLLVQLARLLRLPRAAGLAAAVLYIVFSAQFFGQWTSDELLLIPFTVAALCVAAAGWGATTWHRQVATIVSMGVLFGVALWVKYVAAVPASAVFVALVGSWMRRERGLSKFLALGGLYAVACALPTALSALAYASIGEFAAFWYCNFGFMHTYLGLVPTDKVVRHAIRGLHYIWPLLLCAAAGLYFGWRRRGEPPVPPPAMALLSVWVAAEALAVVAPWKFFDYYFLLLLPPLALLSGVTLCVVADRAVVPRYRAAAPWVLAGMIAVFPLHAVPGLVAGPDTPRRVAAVIRNDPHATAWVVNYAPIIYFLADIPAPTRFPLPGHLVGGLSSLINTDPVAEVERILAGRPRFLVVDELALDHIRPQTAAPIRAALTQRYTRVASFESVGVFRYQTPLEMNRDADRTLRDADAKLNAAITAYRKRLIGSQLAAFDESQRRWDAFRKATCEFAASGSAGSSAYPMSRAACLTNYAADRLDIITGLMQCVEGDFSCPEF